MIIVGRKGLALAIVLSSPLAFADELVQTQHAPTQQPQTAEQLWPALPQDHALSLEDVMTDNLSAIGNEIAANMNLLSHDFIGLHVDGRAQRARLRVGGENIGHYLTFRIDTDWLFAEGKARVTGKVDLGLGKHQLELRLPEMDLTHDSYRGTDLVQVNVPLVERHF